MSRQAIVTLPADNQILVTREVAAPRHLVYRAWTEPDLIRRWWAADRGTMTVAEVDLRPGGTWRYAMIANGGFEVAFHGEYLEVIPGEKIISTEIFEGAPPPPDGQAAWAPAVTTVTFADAPAAGHGGSPRHDGDDPGGAPGPGIPRPAPEERHGRRPAGRPRPRGAGSRGPGLTKERGLIPRGPGGPVVP